MRLISYRHLLLALALVWPAAPALAAECQPVGGFDSWLATFRQEAAAKGISQRGLDALDGVTHDPAVLSHDRGQRVFRQSFEEFAGRMVSAYRLKKGANLLLQHASLLSRIEQQYGAPGPVLVAIWGLESDFGANTGKFATIRSLATLAHDCRRSDMFQAELLAALRIVDRGDLSPSEMRGAWAGELGQTQFMATSYLKFAVDFDGNGRRDLLRSVPDVLASTANYLEGYGWKRGQGWEPGEANFDVLLEWNKSQVYSRTIALFASRLAGRE